MLKKLRLKFVCIMMTVVTVMLVAIFGLVIGFTNERMERTSTEALRRAAMEPGFLRGAQDGELLPYFVMSLERSGMLRISGTIYFEGYTQEQLRSIWDTASNYKAQFGLLEEHDLRFMKAADPMGERIVFLDISAQRMAMGTLTGVCITVGIISFFLLLIISTLLAKWAIRPVETAWEQQRRFVADASHELKTPLTVIMTNAELLQETEDTALRQQSADSILVMSRQMRTLVEGLLELARVDNGAVKRSAEQLDLSALVEEELLPFEPLFFEKGLTLSCEIEPGLSLKGSLSYLRQLLGILLDNAMKYSASGGKVFVVLKKKGSHALLSVANPGGPIPEEELKSIFQRFYRMDKARSRDGSFGLGLSIAQSIAEEHGGKIWAENDESWVVFRVQLPL